MLIKKGVDIEWQKSWLNGAESAFAYGPWVWPGFVAVRWQPRCIKEGCLPSHPSLSHGDFTVDWTLDPNQGILVCCFWGVSSEPVETLQLPSRTSAAVCGNQDNSGISESILIEHWLQIAGTWWCFCTEAKGAVLKTRTGPDIFLFSSPVVSQGLE